MSVRIYKGPATAVIRADRLERFLARGWKVEENTAVLKPVSKSKPKPQLEAEAEVVSEEEDELYPEAPIISMPHDRTRGE